MRSSSIVQDVSETVLLAATEMCYAKTLLLCPLPVPVFSREVSPQTWHNVRIE
jgi:hypothetical protein